MRLPGRARVGNPPFPRGWLPGSRELICYLLGRLPEPSSQPVFAQGRAHHKLKPARRQAPPALRGSCPGLPSMGRSRRAGRSRVRSLGRAGDVAGLAPLLLLRRSHPRPAPRCQGPAPDPGKHAGRQAGVARCQPCSSPPLRHWEIPKPLSFRFFFFSTVNWG